VSSQKITELEALCKRLREDAQKLREEKTTLEGMIQFHDELIVIPGFYTRTMYSLYA
jgi:hypothetical protein